MKVLFVLPTAFPVNRGSPARVSEMCRALSDRGIECHVLSYGWGDDRKVGAVVHRIANLPVYRKGIGPSYARLILDALLLGKALRLCRREKFDIVHAHLHEGAIVALPARLLYRLPVIFDIHSSLADELVDQQFVRRGGLKDRTACFLDRKLPDWVDACVCLSRNVARHFRTIAPDRKIGVIPNATDLSFFRPAPSSVRAKLKLDGRVVVGYQGNMSPMQRLDLLLDVAPRVLAQCPDARFLIGYTSDSEEYLAQVRSRGLADHFVFVESPFAKAPEVINACDLLVIPRSEAFGVPMKLLNFLACGKAVVMHEDVAKGVFEEPRQAGVHTFTDVATFAKAVLALVDDDSSCANAGVAARQFAEREFSPQMLADRLTSMYSTTIHECRQNRISRNYGASLHDAE